MAPSTIDPRDLDTPDAWIPRHPDLIRLTGRHPFNCEPPTSALSTFVTPTDLHFVRNHGAVPKTAWDAHTLSLDGHVATPRTFTMDELTQQFKAHVVSLPVLVVCSGNRRKEQNMLKKTIGFSWGVGAAATSTYTGVPLHVLLQACGVDRARAKHVWFEGADSLKDGKGYGTSIPAHTALDPTCDVMVAWAMNGEPLSVDHGFPLRIIVPGHVGGRMVKWLARITVSDVESTNYYHIHDNRLLPSHIDAERATAEKWWERPEFAIQELNVNSVVLAPAHGDKVVLSGDDFYTIKGYAYSGGGRKVIRVEVTLNDGATWQDCVINYTEQPNAYGKMWCWVHYELTVPVASLLRASEICVRAWDASMNTQPEFPTWNVMGMMNNPWFRVRVHKHETSIAFEHPTQAGALKGGWMTPERIPTSRGAQKQEVAETDDEPTSEVSETVVSVAQQRQHLVEIAAKLPLFSLADVAQHNSKESCWFVCRGLVFDATQFLNDHPGGAASILLCAGTDCTDEFESIHSTKAWQLLSRFLIGRCENASHDDDAASTSESMTASEEDDHEPAVALRGAAKVPIVLIEKKVVSHDTRVFRFALPAKHLALGLPTGNHVFLYGNVHGKTVVRAYTPISENDDLGFVSFLIKVYFAGEDPRFPQGGVFSQYLDDLHLGSRIEMKGPLGHFTYHGLGKCTLDDQPAFHVRKFGLIAGGTGITPIYQLLRAILSSPDDPTMVSLIYCVRSDKDLLLKDEIDALQQRKPAQCRVFYTLTDMPVDEILEDWPYGRTRLTTAMVEDVIGADASHVALCGPPGLIQYACMPALTALGYDCAVQVTQL